jgi:PhzF family phenazine biosynthesis protein
MSKNLFTIDAFSEVPFKGNPAAVILMDADDDISDSILQSIAEEVNLSETAFVRPVAGGDASGEYNLRWFTPTNEVPLCGHATLASAHALFSHPSRAASLPRILRFNTLSGELTVERLPDGDLCMVLPLNAPAACSNNSCEIPANCIFYTNFPAIATISVQF